jgi:hypothetical protein
MSARQEPEPAAQGTLSIGEVLSILKREFPDVTISKIRFLESEGLVTPARTSSGYRRFADEDIRRLRDILTLQRDQYLPGVRPEDFRPGAGKMRLTRTELAETTELEESFVAELEELGLVWISPAGHYDEDAVAICQVAARLSAFGIEGRHLRSFRVVADRESGLIEQMITPFSRTSGRDRNNRAASVEAVREIASLFVQLHGALLRAELIRSGKA